MSQLAAFREGEALSQDEFGQQVGIRSKAYISGLETGALRAPFRLALRIHVRTGGLVPAESLLSPEDAELLRAFLTSLPAQAS